MSKNSKVTFGMVNGKDHIYEPLNMTHDFSNINFKLTVGTNNLIRFIWETNTHEKQQINKQTHE